ncbi:MAG TPA: thioredoxin domain-containing protein, partial [Chitinophagaceae bacterium]|nr:thioredoxin domain-containing protein [Chitinophagaceae bacterium]
LVYFAWQSFSWLFLYPLDHAAAYYLYGISMAAMPITFVSIYLQKFVLKKWCPLCLLICGVLWAQAIVSGSIFFYGGVMEFSLPITLTLSIALTTLLGAWQFIKQMLQKSSKYEPANIQLLSFRRNYRLFMPLYRQLPPVETSIAGMRDIVLGERNAAVNIIIVSNPLCTSCMALHKQLHQWLKRYTDLSITIRFYVPVENFSDKRTLVAAKLIELYMNDACAGLAAIDAWYHEPDFEKFYQKNSRIHHQDALQILKQHRKWCHDQNIFLTPSIIVNKKRFPLFYEPEDIGFFLDELIHVSNNQASYRPPEPEALNAVLS